MLTLDAINEAIDETDFELVEKEYPDMVAGRVAHIDADFLAYMASYEKKDEVNTLEDIIYRTDVMIEDKRRQAGAERAVLHLTPNTSDKGGRYEIAIQKVYQGQRKSDDKPKYLEAARLYMGDLDNAVVKGMPWQNAEADDGMAEAAWRAFYKGQSDRVVIVTKDKDLRMCPGLHLNWDTGTIFDHGDDLFGEISIIERAGKPNAKTGKVTITKKPAGWGTKWFWFQLLMGDTADNIKGCPKAMIDGKHKACGTVGAYALLQDAQTDRECLNICMEAFKSNEYTHWETGDTVPWADVFWSEAAMLWMQRRPGLIGDVKHWVSTQVLKQQKDNS